LPFMSPGPAKAMVLYSSISAEDKRKIASGNLLRLLGLSSLPQANPPQMDAIMATMERGEPVTCVEVLDAHAHIGHPGWLGIHQCSLHEQDAAAMVASMDTAGIRMAMISAWAGITSDEKAGNELVAQAVRDYPGRFIGYASFNPSYPEDLDAEMKRCFEQFGMKGFKPYPPRHQYPLDGANNKKVLEYCNAHHLPILCHYGGNPTGSVTAAQVEKLSEQYLHAKFMFGHSGSSWEAARQTAAVAKKRHNVFMEITYTSVTFGAIEYMAKEAGADKVIFGSDFPMRDPHPQLAWVAYAKLSFEDKRKILGENFKAILADVRPV
ncbi:MAG: amidohydrolase, partial [Planctomycetes bacterium]|nr:amidohydrolase [Planctomycetota bacterium]